MLEKQQVHYLVAKKAASKAAETAQKMAASKVEATADLKAG